MNFFEPNDFSYLFEVRGILIRDTVGFCFFTCTDPTKKHTTRAKKAKKSHLSEIAGFDLPKKQ